jgi:hypothetical protein
VVRAPSRDGRLRPARVADRGERRGRGNRGLLRFDGGRYEWTWAAIGSRVAGEPAAIERIQRSSTHYMQRPDRDYWSLDPTRRCYPGGAP